MSEQTKLRRSRSFRIVLFSIFVISIISIAAAGSFPGLFTFARQADELSGRRADDIRILPANKKRASAPAPVPTCVPPPSGVISWWSAEGNANDRLGRNNAVMQGDATFSAGEVGQAFSFDGSGDFAQIATTSSLPVGASPRTVELWFRTPVNLSSQTESGIFQYGSASNGNMFGLVTSVNASGKLYFYGHNADLSGTTTLLPNTWYHGAVTYNGTTVKLYVNGQLENQAAIALNTVIDSNGITIGHRPGGAFWTGQIDEPTLYDRELSDSEIDAIYNAGSSGKCSNVCSPLPSGAVGWWTGNGNALDIVKGNNGSLVNGVSYAAGKVDQAFSFDQAAQQYVSLPISAANLLNNSNGSIAAWVNPSATGEYDMITAFGSGDPGEAVGIAVNAGNVRVYHQGDPFDWQTATPIPVNTWTYLVYTWDGTTERIYKNGTLADSRARGFNYVTGYARIGFGFINDPSVFFPGLIDEVAIFNRTLGASEISSIYSAASAGMCPHCAPTAGGIISWWPGNGNTNDQVGQNFGTLVNGATYAPGKVGDGFRFSQAGQYVEIPDSPSLRPTTGLSLEGWFKFDNAHPEAALVSKPYSTGSANAYVMWIQSGNLYAGFSGGGALGYPFDPVPGRWYHIAYTYDKASILHRLYVDGNVVASAESNRDPVYDSSSVLIGIDKDNGDPVLGLAGMADEVGVSGQAMSPAEVLAIFNAGISGKCSGCSGQTQNMISWWRGEDNVNDAVGGNFGVLLGGATFAPGRVGRAFSFNGSTATVRIPDSPTLDVTTEFTLGAWIKPASIPSYPNGALVISKVGPIGNLNGYQMAVTNMSGTNMIWCGFNTGGNNWPQYTVSGGNVPVGEWSYVACTYNHDILAVNQNGDQVGATIVGPVTVANTTSNLKLGSDDVGQQFYSGLIDEPMIFGRALSVDDLRSIYEAGSFGVCQTAPPSTPSCGAIPPGMISWWRGENNPLDKRKSHHGSIWGNPVFTTGKVGNAFGFAAGNEAIDAGTWFNLQTFSIEMWVKPNNGQILYANIIDNWHNTSPLRSWVLEDLNTGNIFQWYSADFPAGTNILFELVPDTWQHIVITRDANRVTRGYLNRSLVGSVSSSSDIPYDGTEHLRIGNWYDGNRAFNGTIDEVTIYNRSLSETEIASLYSADSYGKCVGTQTMADMDGDMLSDLSIFRPSGTTGSEWWWLRSTGGNYAVQFGDPTDTIVASDYTGDGKTDVAFWRPSSGMWYILRSEDFSFYAFPFGASGDIPAPADYDGDGKTDATVFRPSTTTWYINKSTGGTGITVFGAAGDKPVPEDYDGDGKADIAVFRPNGTGGAEWWIAQSSGGVFATQFGQPTDKAVPADYTGDGKVDIAFWTPSNGYWYVLRSDDLSYYAFPFGTNGDIPVPADYDGDARADPGVFRPSNSNWYVNRTTAGLLIQQFGAVGDVPVPSEFVR